MKHSNAVNVLYDLVKKYVGKNNVLMFFYT